jgi:carboxymethylenebutenolidase
MADIHSDIHSETLTLSVTDGSKMNAFVARPADSGRGPGIMVFQEIFGVNSHIQDVAQRFARQGYVAIAPEVFHRTAPAGWTTPYSDIEGARAHAMKLTPQGMQADLQTTHQWLAEHCAPGKLAAVGYCLGGSLAVLSNSVVPLAASISFYGGQISKMLEGRFDQIKAPQIFFWGGLDKHIDVDTRHGVAANMRAAKKTFIDVEFSDADHGYFCNDRASYNKDAAEESWSLLMTFLQHRVGR